MGLDVVFKKKSNNNSQATLAVEKSTSFDV